MTSIDGRGPASAAKDRSMGELMRELADETGTLIRQEMALARAELQAKAKEAGAGAGMLSGAGVAALLMLGALTATAIAALDTAMPLWLAALITTALWGAVAGALALVGRGRLKQATPLTPEQTIETTKEDVAWARTRARSGMS